MCSTCVSAFLCQHISVRVFISVPVSGLYMPVCDPVSLCIWGPICLYMIVCASLFLCECVSVRGRMCVYMRTSPCLCSYVCLPQTLVSEHLGTRWRYFSQKHVNL